MTEPLWGVATTAPYGHDGRSTDLEEVILRHGGEAQAARDAFAALARDAAELRARLPDTLVLFPPDDTASNLQPDRPGRRELPAERPRRDRADGAVQRPDRPRVGTCQRHPGRSDPRGCCCLRSSGRAPRSGRSPRGPNGGRQTPTPKRRRRRRQQGCRPAFRPICPGCGGRSRCCRARTPIWVTPTGAARWAICLPRATRRRS